MRIGGSLFLIALGAILRFALTQRYWSSIDVYAVGVILMVVGVIGLAITGVLALTRRRTDIIQRGPNGTSATTYMTPHDPMPHY